MKKVSALILCLALMLGCASCMNSKNENPVYSHNVPETIEQLS